MYISVLVLIGALLIGSFLNVVIYRIPRGESIVWPGSHCTSCGEALKARDLVPVFSYIFLKGRCRYCGEKISIRYPLIEMLTALSFLLVYLKWGISIWTVSGWILTAILIIAAFTDIDEGIIPDRITYPGLIAALLLSFSTIGLKTSITGALAFAVFFLLVAIISRGGMGGGDIKLAGVIGAFNGLTGAFMVLIISSVLGGLWAVVLLLRGKAGRKTAIRFGPFLSISAWVVWMYGLQVLDFYLALII